ncbi:tetratricopeptide repeat-containing sensor histidine kinase [Fulvivirga maritima]|uniref:tetratricopeptide repeat-containing sensor histidine kinase n=1 Tax=Fulvivirga maritima TaxID=2904247 RepID=UPI001F2293DA|nr:tetratricopeptide repeat-containing sensor histidine kinase [Fulvivirga maritima]UII27046.1 tetratricopeptide repeat-containing sensor histidine kinase [Fulvivirga maritima]
MRGLLIVFHFFFLISYSISAQDVDVIDSLRSTLSKELNDTAKVKTYNRLAWEYRKSFPDSSIYYCTQAINLVKVNDYDGQYNLANTYNYMGLAYVYKGNGIKAFDYYTLASEEALAHQDSTQYAHSLNSLGRLFMTRGDHARAYDYYVKSLNIFKRHSNERGLSYVYKSLSELYLQQENYEKALDMSLRALAIRNETGSAAGRISILLELASINQKMAKYDTAFEYYMQARREAYKLNDNINLVNINLGIASLYFNEHTYDSALGYANEALIHLGESGNESLKVRVDLLLGKIYYEENKLGSAKSLLESLLNKTRDINLEWEIQYYLSEICKKQGDVNCAFDHFQQYHRLKGKLNDVAVNNKIERIESRLELGERDAENELLKSQQMRDEALLEKHRYANVILIIVIGAALFLLLVLWYSGRKLKQVNESLLLKNNEIKTHQQQIKEKNDQIELQNQKLTEQNKNLLDLNNEKDTLMSIVAHDLKSPFSRIKGLAQVLSKSSVEAEQRHLLDLQKDVAESGLELISDLLEINAFERNGEKEELTKVDINAFLKEKYQSFLSDAEAKKVQLEVNEAREELIVETGKLHLSRILDNLISNAIKFSKPDSKVILGAVKEVDHFVISVKDFGQGFSETDKKNLYKKFVKLSARPTAGESSNGLGLAIVKNLVEKLGGSITLISEYRKGSEFILKFPTALSTSDDETAFY